jgi:hypothetical protein
MIANGKYYKTRNRPLSVQYHAFVREHEELETYEVYDEDAEQIVALVKSKFEEPLKYILRKCPQNEN